MRLYLLMVPTAILLVAADAPEIELGKLQGTWSLVMVVRDGREIPEDEVSHTTLVIKGDAFAFPHVSTIGSGPSGTFRLGPAETPKAIDATPASGPDAGRTWLGIYEVDGDWYHVCFAPPGKARPAKFSSTPGSGASHSVWRRGRSTPVAAGESDDLLGSWELESVTTDGEKSENPPLKGARYAIAPGRYTVTIGEQTLRVTYTLDRSASPRAIDLTYHEETGVDRTFKAIYKREGDLLTICRPQNPEGGRPKEFTAPAASGRVLLALKKAQP